jgi:tetratricopeptide (TPR) repeat protein
MFTIIILGEFARIPVLPQGPVDSLERALQDARKPEKFEILHQLSRLYIATDGQKALDYASEAIQLSDELNEPTEKTIALKNIGTIYFFQGNYQLAEESLLNSLEISQEIQYAKGIADAYNNLGIINSRQGQYEKALDYYRASLEMKQELGDRQGRANTLNNIGEIHKFRGRYGEALLNYQESYKLKNELGDLQGMANSLNNIGEIYSLWADYEEALGAYQEAASLWTELGNTQLMSVAFHNIGEIYLQLQNHQQAERYFRRALDIQEAQQDLSGKASSLRNLGTIKSAQDSISEAEQFFSEALSLEQNLGNPSGVATSLNHLGELYLEAAPSRALDYFKRSQEINQELGNAKGLARDLYLMGTTYRKLKMYTRSLEHLNQGLGICETNNLPEMEQTIHYALATVYQELGDYRQAFENLNFYQEIKDSLYTEEIHEQISELETKYQTEQKERELAIKDAELVKKEAEIKRRKFQRNALFAGLIMVILLALVIYWSYIQKRKANRILGTQKEEIEEKNQEITASIRYAKNIQEALLPHPGFFREIFPESFIFYRPKDIVSGDFYWVARDHDLDYIAAVDATGHGVPGAFISLLGFNLLNTILKAHPGIKPSSLLDQLNQAFSERMFKSYEQETLRDSMDLALCRIDQKNRKLEYSGAYNPLWIARKGEMIIQKPDKLSVGSFHEFPDRTYTNYAFDLKQGDMIYLFSDGYADQFGGPKSKKFMYKNLEKLLLNHSHKNAREQEAILDRTFTQWIGKEEQVDDIVIIGIRAI